MIDRVMIKKKQRFWGSVTKMASIHNSLLITLVLVRNCFSAEKPDDGFICTEEFCEDYVQRFPCPPLHPACSNSTISLVIPSPTVCNCCEHCFVFQDVGEDCLVGRPGLPMPNVMCKPGTECVEGICKEKNGPDSDFYSNYECQNGICHCTVLVNNIPKKIFGQFKETNDIKKEKQCKCSLSAYRAQETTNEFLPYPDLFIPAPRCLPNGQFDPLQCINEWCMCVDKATGILDTPARKVLIKALSPGNPKCFDEKRHKVGEYYTMCERERNDLMSEILWQKQEGLSLLHSHKVICTPDGKYATATVED